MCSFHDHLVHDRGWALGGDPERAGGLWVRRPDGALWSPRVDPVEDSVAERFVGPVLAGPAGPAGPPPGPAS